MSAATTQTETVGIILAAGHGRRMRSRTPKPLHMAAGKELIRYPVELLAQCGVARIVVVASPDNRDSLAAVLGNTEACAIQPAANGTADAVACALPLWTPSPTGWSFCPPTLPGTGRIPAPSHGRTRRRGRPLYDHTVRRGCFLSRPGTHSAGRLGRLLWRRSGVSHYRSRRPADSSAGPAEVNTGVYCFDGNWLTAAIAEVPPSPSGERYLTELVRIAADAGRSVAAMPIALPDEAMGVNDRLQLSAVETVLRDRINCHWMRQGVTIIDTATTYIDSEVTIAPIR